MAPSDSLSPSQPWERGGVSGTASRSDATSPQRRNDESWVEISSQPSSSSLSSVGDDIVTTGLRVRAGTHSYPPRRRRSSQQTAMPTSYIVSQPPAHAGTSSQEEYEETESEEDRVITSSTEQIRPSATLNRQETAYRACIDNDTDSDDDDDENATALGRPTATQAFRPQPNAFSHPPSHLTHRHSTSSTHPYHAHLSRPSPPTRSHTRPHRTPNFMSPSYQADNDAALRASLTTLLSCAAAARGLPKKDEPRTGLSGADGLATPAGVVPSSQPMGLRLVPESELISESPPPPPAGGSPASIKVPQRTASNSSAPSAPSSTSSREKVAAMTTSPERSKRMATTQNKPQRAVKKKRTAPTGFTDSETASLISPTLLTWVVSAGVVVLVSVVGFGAGYVIGREVGRQEGATSLGLGASSEVASKASASCGRELARNTSTGTLRRFRWGSVGKSITA